MRALGFRIFRILLVALVAYAAVAWAYENGHAWLGYGVAATIFSVWLGFGLWAMGKTSRAQREARWEAAIFEPARRARVITEVKRAIKKLTPARHGARDRHAKLSVLLAELLDADGAYEDAMAAVDDLTLGGLPALDVGLVRHTRAVTHLRGGDATGALSALQGRAACGDRELDLRLDLLEAYARIELGQIDEGLAAADRIADASDIDDSVTIEAGVVRAAGLDAQGRREDALVLLASLGRDALLPLSELGHPRVRGLAATALQGLAI